MSCSGSCSAYAPVHRRLLRQPLCYDGSSRDERVADQPQRLSRAHLATDERRCSRLRSIANCKLPPRLHSSAAAPVAMHGPRRVPRTYIHNMVTCMCTKSTKQPKSDVGFQSFYWISQAICKGVLQFYMQQQLLLTYLVANLQVFEYRNANRILDAPIQWCWGGSTKSPRRA